MLIAASLVAFQAWVLPANRATANWTIKPDDLATIRTQWEHGHLVIAGLVMLTFVATSLATVNRNRI